MLRRLLAEESRGRVSRASGAYRQATWRDPNPCWRSFEQEPASHVRRAMSQPKKQCAGCCLWFDEEVLFVSAKGKRACGRCIEHARRVLTPVDTRDPVQEPLPPTQRSHVGTK